jgi:Nif-specific regulatory protein
LSPALHLARTQRGTGDRHSLAHLCAITYVTWLRIPLVESTQSGVMATTTDPPTDQEAFLVAREGGAWCEIYKLAPANKMTVGRDPASLIVLSDDKCSRRHAEIELSQDGWLIEDLNSRNGTKINGTRITERVGLAPGDVIGIGSLELLFTYDLAQPLDVSNNNKACEETTGTKSLTESIAAESLAAESLGSEILERKAQTRYVTESNLEVGDQDNGVREAISILYRLVVKMVRATDVTEVSVMALDGLLKAISVDLGAVLLFPNDVQNRSDPESLRIIAFRAPENTPYHKVSLRLSRTALLEKQAILGIDVNKEASGFQTLSDMRAQSVICAPIRHDDRIMGLVHLYSLQASTVLGANALEFSLAVADQLALALSHLADRDSLTDELERACHQNRSLRQLLEVESDLIGSSVSMRRLRDSIARVARSEATALVRGESGVGKELVARAIHFNSNRRDAPIVCLNCAALSETLLESELFGHEQGSFTGATNRKIGKFEQADGGTLFLDEVGEMSMTIQAKFLRALEGHPFERVGGHETVHVDTRVVSATNRNLEKAVEAGEFRKDLYYRLQILEIRAPSLREHDGDIPELVTHFLARSCQRVGRSVPRISRSAVELLVRNEWPGNVRELRNVIERALVFCEGDEIQASDIHFTQRSDPSAWIEDVENQNFRPQSLELMERDYIARTLKWTDWNKREAARILGINRSTLDRKLERYEISKLGSKSS